MDTRTSGTNHHAPTTPDAIQLDRYVPFFLGAIVNKWTSVSSKTYRGRYGLGIGEWRLLASLGTFKTATSLEISKLVKMDAGAVSRGIRVLEDRGLIAPVVGRFIGRNKPYTLTDEGREVHEGMKGLALARERKLLNPLTDEQRAQFLQLLNIVYEGLEELDG